MHRLCSLHALTRRVSDTYGCEGEPKTKETLAKFAAPVIKTAGYQLVGIAPTSCAADNLAKDEIYDKVMTTQQYCLTPYGDKNTVLVVDESSMLGTKSMENILSYARERHQF